MRKRAEAVDQTRLRITEAAVRLHTSVGPAHTTMSGVAQEAGVSRVTLYRHFPDEAHLFAACSAHWAQQHPPPDPATWSAHEPGEPRVRAGLAELYSWYRTNDAALALFDRDAHALPAPVRTEMQNVDTQMAGALIAGTSVRGAAHTRLRAVAGHVVSYRTWRSLAVDQGLGTQAVDVAVAFFLAAQSREL
jgi:AcrR family transcriptional regulator